MMVWLMCSEVIFFINHTVFSCSGVELSTLEVGDINEESTMERMLCIELTNIFGGLERTVTVSVAPELTGFSTIGKCHVIWWNSYYVSEILLHTVIICLKEY